MEGLTGNLQAQRAEQDSKGVCHPLSSSPGHQGLERACQG